LIVISNGNLVKGTRNKFLANSVVGDDAVSVVGSGRLKSTARKGNSEW